MQKIIHKSDNSESNLPHLVTTPFTINPHKIEVDLKDFIYIPQKKIFIKKSPTEYNSNWKETHHFLADIGLFMPDISTFIIHYMNLREAAQDREEIFYGDGNKVSLSDAFDLWKRIVSANFKKSPGLMVWLDNLWNVKDHGEYGKKNTLTVTTHHKVRLKKGELELSGRKRTFEDPFEGKYRYTTKLPLSPEGFPLNKADTDARAPGITLEFGYPKDGMATRFRSENLESVIECDISPETARAYHLFGCAYSTQSLKI